MPALEVFQAVSGGIAQIGHTASLFWGGKLPAAPLFTAGPFGLTPLEHITWINHGGGQQVWDALYAPFGLKPLMGGNTGFQMGGWYKQEVTGLDSLRGLKIRMPGIGGAVLRKLGAAPVTLAPGEILSALQTGAIDATEFLGPSSDFAMGFYKAAKSTIPRASMSPTAPARCCSRRRRLMRCPPTCKPSSKPPARKKTSARSVKANGKTPNG